MLGLQPGERPASKSGPAGRANRKGIHGVHRKKIAMEEIFRSKPATSAAKGGLRPGDRRSVNAQPPLRAMAAVVAPFGDREDEQRIKDGGTLKTPARSSARSGNTPQPCHQPNKQVNRALHQISPADGIGTAPPGLQLKKERRSRKK